MIRLHMVVEGQTEEAFVNNVLRDHLATHGIYADTRCVETGRYHGTVYRGGLVNYEKLAIDLAAWMKQDGSPECWFTTMVDFFRLPADFPDRAAVPVHLPAPDQVARLERAMKIDMVQRLEGQRVADRFIPYIQIHEFEALLFADPTLFGYIFPDNANAAAALTAIRACFAGPEEINGGANTAPSKRILAIAPTYDKVVDGPELAELIGIQTLCDECPHFNEWVARLKALGAEGAGHDDR